MNCPLITTGVVGIGTTGPVSLLDIYGTGDERITVRSSDTGSGNYTGFQLAGGTGSIFEGGMYLNNANKGTVEFWDASTDVMNLNGSNVGIGTASPQAALDVNGAGRFFATPGGDNGVLLSVPNMLVPGLSGLAIGYNQVYNSTSMTNSGYLQAETQGSTYRSLLLNPLGGNVGIGTTSPSGTLDIENGSNTANVCLNGNCIQKWTTANYDFRQYACNPGAAATNLGASWPVATQDSYGNVYPPLASGPYTIAGWGSFRTCLAVCPYGERPIAAGCWIGNSSPTSSNAVHPELNASECSTPDSTAGETAQVTCVPVANLPPS